MILRINAKPYLAPGCEVEETLQEVIICTSPEEGGLECVNDEDWVI